MGLLHQVDFLPFSYIPSLLLIFNFRPKLHENYSNREAEFLLATNSHMLIAVRESVYLYVFSLIIVANNRLYCGLC